MYDTEGKKDHICIRDNNLFNCSTSSTHPPEGKETSINN